jgi:RNA polymerase sigma-70 factor (ECF subfamily)
MQSCVEQGTEYQFPVVIDCPSVDDSVPDTERTPVCASNEAATDRRLVEQARRGDAQSLSELIQRNYQHCLKIALGILRNRDDAEDEVQNAFWKAIERFEQYKGEGPFGSWLARIVANESYVRFRTERHVRFFRLDESISASTGAKLELVDQRILPDDQLGRHEVQEVVDSEIRHMPPLLRRVLQLRDVQQLPMSRVAEELQVTIPAAKSRLARARRELRSRLTKHGGRNAHQTLLHESFSRPVLAVANGD